MKFTYFIQEGSDGPIKIGSAQNPDERLLQLQTASSRDLVMLIATTLVEERAMHAEFADCRLRGEWFRPDARIHERIDSIKADLKKYPKHCWESGSCKDTAKTMEEHEAAIVAQRTDPAYLASPKHRINVDLKALAPGTLEELQKRAEAKGMTLAETMKAILSQAAEKQLAEMQMQGGAQ